MNTLFHNTSTMGTSGSRKVLLPKDVKKINETLQNYVKKQSLDEAEYAAGGPVMSTGAHAVYEF